MNDVTQILSAIEQGDPQAAEQLLPLVYGELRKLAAQKLDRERPGHTLQATALVHEAYLKLVGETDSARWLDARHFYRAAAEAMRRILVDHSRRRHADRRGGDRRRVPLGDVPGRAETDWVVVDEALERLTREDPGSAELVRLKVFAGLSIDEAAQVLGVSRATAYRDWSFARAWLRDDLAED